MSKEKGFTPVTNSGLAHVLLRRFFLHPFSIMGEVVKSRFSIFRKTKPELVRGFTLIETVIYTAMLGLLFAVVVSTVVNVITLYKVFDVHRDIQDSAIASLDRMTREMRGARSVSTSGSVFNAHPGTLIVSTNQGGDAIVREFSLDNGVLHLYEDGVDQGPLTAKDVTVTNLVFRYTQGDKTDLVKIEMQLQAGTGEEQEIRNFYISTVLRGSYDN